MNTTNDLHKDTWNQLQGKPKQQDAQLTVNDLLHVKGKENERHGRRQKALGHPRMR